MIFNHIANFEVKHLHDECTVTISVNDQTKFQKTYAPGLYNETVGFTHEYGDGKENILKLSFTSAVEAHEKHIIVNDITINDTRLETINCLYEPQVNQDWWQSLSDEDQQMYERIIYGNANSHYGWYGNVYYTYFTGMNAASTYNANNQFDRLFTRKTEWVLQDTDSSEFPWR